MNSQETIVKLIQEGLPMLVTAAKAIPADKYDWKPEATSRSAKEVFVEAVTMLTVVAGGITERTLGDYETPSKVNASLSVEELSVKAEKDAEALYAVIRSVPDDQLEQPVTAPWATWTVFQTMSYAYWNIMWHAGQINYIQSLYGDTEMH